MTSLIGRLVSQTEVTSSPDVFFEIFALKPFQLVNAAPDIFQSLDLLDGLWGTVGAIISGTYVDEGKIKMAKAIVVALDENNKSATYKVIAGDLMSLYTTISVTFQAGIQGGKNLVTWTMEYLKLFPNTPAPNSLMNLAINATKEIDAQNLK